MQEKYDKEQTIMNRKKVIKYPKEIVEASTRFRILFLIRKRIARTPSELAVALEKSNSTISQHLNILEKEGLIEFENSGKYKVYWIKNATNKRRAHSKGR